VIATTMTSAGESIAIQPAVVVGASGASRPFVRVLASAIHTTVTNTGTMITTALSPADGERARVHRPRDQVSAGRLLRRSTHIESAAIEIMSSMSSVE
jgi:hypothetical protein